MEFGVISRTPAVGGQLLSLQGLRARYDDVFLPLYGAHQAQNAAVALAAVEAFIAGSEPLDHDLVRAAFAEVTSPGRLEIMRTGPTILLDAAHNPHGAAATAAALEDSFTLDPLIGVIGVMGDKDAEGLLAAFEPHLAHVVCTQNSTDRAMPAAELAVVAVEVYGEERVSVEPRLADAIDLAVRARGGRSARPRSGRAASSSPARSSPPARRGRCCGGGREQPRPEAERSPRRGMCAAVLSLEGVTLGLTTPVMIKIADVGTLVALGVGLGLAVLCLLVAGLLRSEWAYWLGWLVQLGAIGLGFVIGPMFFLGDRLRPAVGDGVPARPQDRAGAGRGVRRVRGGAAAMTDPSPTPLSSTERTRITRLRERGRSDRSQLLAFLGGAMVAHVAVDAGDHPVTLPVAYGVDPDGPDEGGTIYVHGSVGAGWLGRAPGSTVCVTVTSLDGLVLARSGFHHSMNYRCAVIIGTARLVESDEERARALDLVVDQIVPGRAATLRPHTRKELVATAVLAVPMQEASLKLRAEGVGDEPEDIEAGIWAGVLPLRTVAGDLEADPLASAPVPHDVAARAEELRG